jgi:hypothetical protein
MRIRLAIAAALLAVGTLAIATSAPASAGTDERPRAVAAGIVRLDGRQEVPGPGDPDGRGVFGYVAFDSQLCYILTARNIAPATAAHIHAGRRGVAGGIVVGLQPPTSGVSFDCIRAVPASSDPMALLQSELDAIIARPHKFYVNVHNAEFPDGAIRGQLR